MRRHTTTARVVATAITIAAGLLGVSVAPVSAEVDRDCGDFSTQKAAQDFFLGHNPSADPHRLDYDGDGLACESNPCPCSTSTTSPTQFVDTGTTTRTRARVIRVSDGDTILVGMPNGARRYVRLIGIDTPEVYGTSECGGSQASQSLKNMLAPGTGVLLVSDPSQANKDRYDRLLRYVIKRSSQVDVGRAQLQRGWAGVYVYDNNPFKRVASYREAQYAARSHDRGIWSICR